MLDLCPDGLASRAVFTPQNAIPISPHIWGRAISRALRTGPWLLSAFSGSRFVRTPNTGIVHHGRLRVHWILYIFAAFLVCCWVHTGDDLRLSRYSKKPVIMADDTQKQDVIRLEERTLQQDIIADYEGEKSKRVLRKVSPIQACGF